MDLSGGGALVLRGKAAYPTFASSFFQHQTQSDDANQAIVLVHGDDPVVKMGLKGAGGPFDGQASLPTILAPYLDGNGKISLPSNEALVLYEMSGGTSGDVSEDYQDLVLKIRTGCAIGSEVVLRDSIGFDNGSTNGNWPWNSESVPSDPIGYMAPGTVSVSENVKLTEFRAIGAQQSPMLDFNQFDYWLRIWSSETAAIADLNHGDIANIFFDIPTTGPTNFGVTVDQGADTGVRPTWDMRFNISSSNIQVSAGQTIVIGVQVQTSGTLGGGLWGWMESSEIGPSDLIMGSGIPNGWMRIGDNSASFYDGRLGIKLTAQTQ